MLAFFLPVSPLLAETTEPTLHQLDNGLQILVVPNSQARAVYHSIWYKVGAMDEIPSQSGIAHLLEHLLFKATKNAKAGEF
ncbi:MAG: insulinase family protein, partial [Pseudomonadota bacterium]